MPELNFEEPAPRPRTGKSEEIILMLLQMKEHPGKYVRLGTWEGPSGANNMKAVLERRMNDRNDRSVVGKYVFEVRRENYVPKASGGSILYGTFIGNGDD